MAVGCPSITSTRSKRRKLSRLLRLHETELQRGFCYWLTAEDTGTLGEVLEGDFRIKYRRMRGNSRVKTANEIFFFLFFRDPLFCFGVSGGAQGSAAEVRSTGGQHAQADADYFRARVKLCEIPS